MQERRSLPNPDQLSLISGMILIGFLLLPYLDLPARQFSLHLLQVDLLFELQINTLISLLLAAMSAVGVSWLLQNHPFYRGQPLWLHAILPALSVWVISIPLSRTPLSPQWWWLFLVAAILQITVLSAEFIVLDAKDERYQFASMGLTALSFALYLFLAIATRGAGLRLYVVSSTMAIGIFPIVLRTLYLRLDGVWHFSWALGIALVIGQLSAGLHYLPISPLLFGALMLTVSFTLVNLAHNIIKEQALRAVWIESAAVGMILTLIVLAVNRLR